MFFLSPLGVGDLRQRLVHPFENGCADVENRLQVLIIFGCWVFLNFLFFRAAGKKMFNIFLFFFDSKYRITYRTNYFASCIVNNNNIIQGPALFVGVFDFANECFRQVDF